MQKEQVPKAAEIERLTDIRDSSQFYNSRTQPHGGGVCSVKGE